MDLEMKICLLRQSWTKGCRQINEINKVSMECFKVNFLRFFFTKKHQNLALGWRVGYSPSNPSMSGIFLKFLNLKSKVVKQLVRQLVYSLFGDNNLVPFHLWWRETVLKREKGYKCFVQDCRLSFRILTLGIWKRKIKRM